MGDYLAVRAEGREEVRVIAKSLARGVVPDMVL